MCKFEDCGQSAGQGVSRRQFMGAAAATGTAAAGLTLLGTQQASAAAVFSPDSTRKRDHRSDVFKPTSWILR